MAKLRQRECARKVGPYKTAGPVPLKNPQCCTYQKGLKYVQANACPCRSANRLCTSSFSSEDFSNRVPTRTLPPWGRPRAPTTLRITANVKQNIDEAHKAASILHQATPPQSSFTPTYRRYDPASPQAERSGMPYRLAPKPSTRPKCSPRPPPLTLPHQLLSEAAKEIQIAHDQRMVKSSIPDHPPTHIVMLRQRRVLEGATETMNMSSLTKHHPQACPTCRTSRDTSENWK